MRELTGFTDIRKVDAQATRYLPGHFLTAHDDDGSPTGQIRRVAYVLSLSERWHPDWGGLLNFYDGDSGQIQDTFVPAYNTLSLFTTPQYHAVSTVAPYAPLPRLSITGWLRAD
ncbi:2OG-Fe(II) oxygenase [Pseudoxanthomonas sp. CAU 1598]|uniref:2OG-Fe(II) oxygenase n=2 Tax=Pseudomarimonas arenosa TaxID=2774145 RepID=A0AAW3ZGL5_9GAMM|nr:2OG-Fe(II) oxygenase [Pseudomarimonas arenosa]